LVRYTITTMADVVMKILDISIAIREAVQTARTN
jgi:hypothetical protein